MFSEYAPVISKIRLLLFCLFFSCVLVGCASPGFSTLSPSAIDGLHLTRTEVDFTPQAFVDVGPYSNSSEFAYRPREYVREHVKAHVKEVLASEFDEVISPKLTGSRPVYARITVNRFLVPGVLLTALASGSLEADASVDLVDSRSGETLASAPTGAVSASVLRPGGALGLVGQAISSADPVDKDSRVLASKFARAYWIWLSQKSAPAPAQTQ